MATVVDSSVLIDLERRRLANDPVSLEALPTDALLPAVVLAELLVGVELATAERRPAREAFIEDLLERLVLAPFGEEEARVFAHLYAALRKAGNLIGAHDLQIAATAVAGGHALLTMNNSEFSRVPGLRVIPPPRGS